MSVTLHGPDGSGHDPNHERDGQAAQPSGAPGPQPARPASPGVERVKDSLGRWIGVRRIGPRERMRLAKVIGAKNSANEEYKGYATLAYACAEIDGDPVLTPATELQIEALVERLGDEGLSAIGRKQLEWMGLTEQDLADADGDMNEAVRIAARRKQAETLAAAKN